MKVLLVATDFPPTRGGIQTMLREFVTRTSLDVRVIAPADPGFAAFDTSLGVPVRRVRGFSAKGSRRGFVPSLALATIRSSSRWRPDVIFAGHVLAAPGPLWVRRRSGTPVVIGTYGVELVAPRLRKVAARVLPKADAVLAVSRFTMDAARSLGVRGGEVIPVGAPDPKVADPGAIAALRARFGLEGRRVLLTVARLEPHKGIDVVVKALPSLPSDVSYVVVGSGPARGMFEAVARSLGIADRVVFAGGLSDEDLAAAFRVADAFVLASRSLEGGSRGVEGCPVSLLEAAAYGLPIVAANTGGIADAVRDGETGLLADPEDIPAVAAALRRVLETDFGRRLAAAAQEMAGNERSWKVVVARMDELIETTALR